MYKQPIPHIQPGYAAYQTIDTVSKVHNTATHSFKTILKATSLLQFVDLFNFTTVEAVLVF